LWLLIARELSWIWKGRTGRELDICGSEEIKLNAVATGMRVFRTSRRHRRFHYDSRDLAYFDLPPLAVFLVPFFLAIAPPFAQDGLPYRRNPNQLLNFIAP
jgi:hypothetical protein